MANSVPNILVLQSDQHSFRHLGERSESEGGEPVNTPTLDDLAESSARFDSAYCPTPLCTPSRLSTLTGREAHRAGAWGINSVLPPDLPTLPGTLSESGYETCLVGKMHLGGSRQYIGFDNRPYGDLTGNAGHQGEPPNPVSESGKMPAWDRLITDVGETNLPESLLQEQNVVQESMSFLREHSHHNPDEPWLLWASFSRPHWPRTAPSRHLDRYWPDDVPEPKVTDESDTYHHPAIEELAEFITSREITDEQRRKARAAYFACVDYLDEIIGNFLLQLENSGLLENTIVVYLSDHGELAGEHGLWEKNSWHEASARVPMFVQLPAHRSGTLDPQTFDTPVSLLDLYPTLCGFADVSPPEDLDGLDLSNAIESNTSPQSRPIFVDGFFAQNSDHHYRMVRHGDYKYVQFRDAQNLLFDLESDPLELENLLESDQSGIDQVHNRLRKMVSQSINFEEVDAARERDEELKEEFKLGVATGDPNQYQFPTGKVIDADTPIYHPHVICDSPELIFADYPESDNTS